MFVSPQFASTAIQQRPNNTAPRFGTVVDTVRPDYIPDKVVYGEFDWQYRDGETVPVKMYTDKKSVEEFKAYLDKALQKFNDKHGNLPVINNEGNFWMYLNEDAPGEFQVGYHHWNPVTLDTIKGGRFDVSRDKEKSFMQALDVILRGIKGNY